MVANYGNPLQEQKDLLAGNAFVVLAKKVLVVSGEERLMWLNNMFSQKLDELAPMVSTEALWLDMNGRILRDFHIVDDGQSCYLITFSAGFDELVTAMQRLVFRSKVTLDHKPEHKVIGSFTKGLPGLINWKDPWPETSEGGFRYGARPEHWDYFESVVLELPELQEARELALTALRIAAHRPQGPDEIDERSIPHEYDWLATAVHLKKGCYRGQETVAKVHNLGHPPRRLVFVHLDGSQHELPEAGAEILAEEVIGKLTSVGQHFESGPIALGLVKRNFTGTHVKVKLSNGEEVSGTLEEIVPPDAGAVVDVSNFRKKN